MADPNPHSAMSLSETLANNMNESLQWMSRMWGSPAGASTAGPESMFGSPASRPPGLPSMLMPTLDPVELDKRIGDLKTVAQWLDMNRALLHTTIQTLEMQRNTIVALQSMARSTQAGSFAASVGNVDQAAASGASANPPGETAAGMQPPPFNPAQWWEALQEQFARVASTAASEPGPSTDGPPAPAEAPPDPRRPAT